MITFRYFSIMRGVLVAFLALFLLGLSENASAASSDRFSGWAWSENIGWISFNCTNTGSCEDSDYGVTMTTSGGTTEDVSGWAWSENIGWIDFSNATYTYSSGSFSGTAVVHSTTLSPYRSGDAEDDGWDGIINISGTIGTGPGTYTPYVDITDNEADGWSWGDNQFDIINGHAWGDESVGWIRFSCQASPVWAGGPVSNTCATAGYGVLLDPLGINFTADKGLTIGDPVTNLNSYNHIWTVEPTSDVVSCVGSGGPVGSDWASATNKSFTPPPIYGQVNGSILSGTSTLSCLTTSGKTVTKDRYIYVLPPPPIMTLDADDYNIPYNTATNIDWTTQYADTCTFTGPSSGTPAYSDLSVASTSGTITSGALIDLDNYFILKCTSEFTEHAGFEFPITALVNVEKLIMDFYAVDAAGDRLNNQDLVAYTTKNEIQLRWDTEFATGGCSASGDWSGTKVASSSSNDVVNGTELALLPDSGTFSFVLDCSGSNGQTAQQTVTFKLGRNPNFSEEITNDLQ